MVAFGRNTFFRTFFGPLSQNIVQGEKMPKTINMSPEEIAIEYMKCKLNPLYFIEKYVMVPTGGGPKPICSEDMWKKTNKYRLMIKSNYKFHRTLYLASRQTGKTSLAAAYIVWLMNFFSPTTTNSKTQEIFKIGYITIDKNRSYDMISRVKFIHQNLPVWLRTPPTRSTSDRLTYFKLTNGAHLITAYVSSSTPADAIFRGMSLSHIFWDETAFTPHADDVYTSIAPAWRKSAEDAASANRPYTFSSFSTPNGSQGLFYDLWVNATDVTELLIDPNDPLCDEMLPKEECLKILNQPGRNGYVKVRLHWSEIYDENWYEEQKRLLNFSKRRIAQEIDIVFLGSSNSIFDDEIYMELEPSKTAYQLELVGGAHINFFTEKLNPSHTYLIGCDVAASASETADYSAISVWDATENIQVAEMRARIPILKNFARSIDKVVQFLIQTVRVPEENIRVIIERNSFGLGIIEYLMYDDEVGDLYNRIMYYTQKSNDWLPGLITSAGTRPLIINSLIQQVNEDPKSIKGALLQDELRTLVQKSNGRIEASGNNHDDLTFATAFTTYVRQLMIKNGEISVGNQEAQSIKISNYLNSVLVQDTKKDENEHNFELRFESDMPKTQNKPDPWDFIKTVL